MKSITVPSDGRSSSVDNNSSSSDVDGSGEPGFYTRRQEESVRSSGSSDEICERSSRDRVWEEVEYLLGSLSRIKEQISNGTDWDPFEVDWLKERYRLCRRQATHYVLCLNLSNVLSKVSFPGEKLTYLQIAERVIKDCNTWELTQAIQEIGLHPHERIYFKVTDGMPIERAEQILLTMLGDGEYILAGDYPKALDVTANSGWYKELRIALQNKGWSWKTKRVNGVVCKVIEK